jgi:exopolyphosphatase/guanosine-5'-triphosphate,3'-diphosphate pyrophosphatase
MKPDVAVIDIGSNSVRLMLAATDNGRVRAISKELATTRLAKGLDAMGLLAEDRTVETVRAIGAFSDKAKKLGVPIVAYATSAVRDAENRDAFLSRVLDETGVKIRVLSGAEEGAYAFSAVTGGRGSVFDIGGGSFQIVTGERSLSFPCGCVRAKDRCDANDTETLRHELFAWMDERTEVPESVPQPVYGVGGTITTIGAFLAKQSKFDPMRLGEITLEKLDGLTELLASIPEQIRMMHPLLTRRGDVILQGATILRYMMLRTHTETVIPSDRDGMEGIAEAFLYGGMANEE